MASDLRAGETQDTAVDKLHTLAMLLRQETSWTKIMLQFLLSLYF